MSNKRSFGEGEREASSYGHFWRLGVGWLNWLGGVEAHYFA